jgi:hypothetical protein
MCELAADAYVHIILILIIYLTSVGRTLCGHAMGRRTVSSSVQVICSYTILLTIMLVLDCMSVDRTFVGENSCVSGSQIHTMLSF